MASIPNVLPPPQIGAHVEIAITRKRGAGDGPVEETSSRLASMPLLPLCVRARPVHRQAHAVAVPTAAGRFHACLRPCSCRAVQYIQARSWTEQNSRSQLQRTTANETTVLYRQVSQTEGIEQVALSRYT